MGRIQQVQKGEAMTACRRGGVILMVCAVGMLLGACVTTYPSREVSYKAVDVDRPATALKDAEVLGVRIATFDPGKLPEDPSAAKGLSGDIRHAEAYYFPVQLKNTMQRSGHWGPVRVVPVGTVGGEVIVEGKILESDGEILKLEIAVKDSTGESWFTKEYQSVIDESVYRNAQQQGGDPFQPLYNQVANDIAAHRKKLTEKKAVTIRQVAELKFGADFAPDVYKGYLRKGPVESAPKDEDGLKVLAAFFQQSQAGEDEKPVYTVLRLPSEQDPLVQRVARIRAREDLLIDTLDQQYDGLARDIGPAYTNWRQSRLSEMNAIRQVDQAKAEQQGQAVAIGILGILAGAAIGSQKNCYGCQTTGAVVAGAAMAIAVQKAVQASTQAESEAAIRKVALEELGRSIVADVKPIVINVEGEAVELKGSVESKFAQWRDVLKKLHAQEVEPTPSPASPIPTSAPKTS